MWVAWLGVPLFQVINVQSVLGHDGAIVCVRLKAAGLGEGH